MVEKMLADINTKCYTVHSSDGISPYLKYVFGCT